MVGNNNLDIELEKIIELFLISISSSFNTMPELLEYILKNYEPFTHLDKAVIDSIQKATKNKNIPYYLELNSFCGKEKLCFYIYFPLPINLTIINERHMKNGNIRQRDKEKYHIYGLGVNGNFYFYLYNPNHQSWTLLNIVLTRVIKRNRLIGFIIEIYKDSKEYEPLFTHYYLI